MNTEIILLIFGAAIATYLTRFPLMIFSGRGDISKKTVKFMSFIAPAVLTSLIVPIIFIREGSVNLSLGNLYIPAALITVLAAYYSRNMLISVITGISTVGLLMLLF